jgi:hypothetical protein
MAPNALVALIRASHRTPFCPPPPGLAKSANRNGAGPQARLNSLVATSSTSASTCEQILKLCVRDALLGGVGGFPRPPLSRRGLFFPPVRVRSAAGFGVPARIAQPVLLHLPGAAAPIK